MGAKNRSGLFSGVGRAFSRARFAILSVGAVYALAAAAGMVMVHSGSDFAVDARDRLVGRARSSPALQALEQDDRLRAALIDFGGNLLGALSTCLAGLGAITSYPLIAYRGWIGGIVSITGAHTSRLADPHEAAYYLITLVLQLIPYTLSGGAGVNVGFALWRPKPHYLGAKWLGLPREALLDGLRIVAISIPLFLIASLWEFLGR
jgi:hypothetical protein